MKSNLQNNESHDGFPFPKGFQFREHEATALEALFERSFFDASYDARGLDALSQIRFQADEDRRAADSSMEDSLSPVILCRGADGIGKTRTFRHLIAHAQERDVAVYESYNYDVEGIPLKPFLSTIRHMLGDLEIGSALTDKYRYALEALMPDAFDVRDKTDPFSADKVRIFDGLTQLLIEASTQKPVLLLVHDLHFGDLATVELLRYIGRNVQLRNQILARGQRADVNNVSVSENRGPEFDGFESDEWRVLTPRPVAPHVYGSWHDDGSDASLPQDWNEAAEGALGRTHRPARLVILANYRASVGQEQYIQRSIDGLGEESYTYHCELKPLLRQEADVYVQRTIHGVELDDGPLSVSSDGVEAVYEATEGFPSFQNELFRGLFLSSQGASWTKETIESYVAQNLPDGSPRRHAILKRRLEDTGAAERQVLEVLAIARRPLKTETVHRVLEAIHDAGVSSTLEETLALLGSLETSGIVARQVTVTQSADSAPETFFFRLWDYVDVVEASIDEARSACLHQGLATELEKRLGDAPNRDGAYEIYYHYRRGVEPLSAVEFGLTSAGRLVESLALNKARLLYEELLELFGTEGATDEQRARRLEILELVARSSWALRDFEAAEAACRQLQLEDKGTLDPEKRVELLILEAEATAESDLARAIKIISKAPKLLADENSVIGARLYLATAQLRLRRQDWKRAMNFGLKGLAICQKLEGLPETSEFYQLLGRAFYRKGDYAHAVDNFQRGLEEAEALESRPLMVSVLDELGRVYLERGEYFRSARYLYKSLEIRHRDQDVSGLCKSYDQLALCYQRNGDYLKTIENLNRSLHLKERVGDLEALNPTLGTLGDLYFRLGYHQRAIRYFRREIDNSRALKSSQFDSTVWLVDAFIRLGRVYLELGESKQAESLCKQATILATEFKLRSKEADANFLQGKLLAFDRDWTKAERSLRAAGDAFAKLGHRRREALAFLDLAEVKFGREQYDEALKIASRAQIGADAIKGVDLQVRALTLKGNVYRFLKGGNDEKVKENFTRALELGQNLNDSNVLFGLFYSVAKVYHAAREFTEANNYYGKAELILKRVLDLLPEDLVSRYRDDRRRKVFFEDLDRFRKEASSRTALSDVRDRGLTGSDLRDRPVSANDYRELLERVLRASQSIHQLDLYERLLAECTELAGADRGLLVRVQKREYIPVTFQGFGRDPAQHPEFAAASQLAEEAIRRGKTIRLSSADEESNAGRLVQLGALAGRVALAVPLMTEERIFGGIYIDKPISHGKFGNREEHLIETFARHAGVAFQNRRQLDIAIQEPLTGFYTPSYFIDRLKDAYRYFNLHGKVFSLAGFHLPALENALNEGRELGEKLSRDLADVLPYHSAVCWGNPILYVLLDDHGLTSAKEAASRVGKRLEALLGEETPHEVLVVGRQFQQGAEMYFETRRLLMPEDTDQRSITELRSLLSADLTIKDAKRTLERQIIERTMRRTNGNITHAAKQLGIHRPQLSNLLKKHALKRESFERPGPAGN